MATTPINCPELKTFRVSSDPAPRLLLLLPLHLLLLHSLRSLLSTVLLMITHSSWAVTRVAPEAGTRNCVAADVVEVRVVVVVDVVFFDFAHPERMWAERIRD